MKDSENPAVDREEEESDNGDQINDSQPTTSLWLSGGVPPLPGFGGQPHPTHGTYGTHAPPTLGAYMAGTGPLNPMLPPPMPLNALLPPPPVHLLQQPVGRGPSALRQPRQRAPVPPSDAHTRVPANHIFPQAEERVQTGMRSGRNFFVLRDGDSEPVLRTPLRIMRSKRDPAQQQNNTQYPSGNATIPAGTSLTQICQGWPRHVWGEMLRIFLSEQWDARRIWDLLPPNARNNAQNRPWNYIQAAMGREVDLMMQEDTGERRVPVRKPKSPSPDAEEGTQVKTEMDEGEDDGVGGDSSAGCVDLNQGFEPSSEEEERLTVEQLRTLATHLRLLGVGAQAAVLYQRDLYNRENREESHQELLDRGEVDWVDRHRAWFRHIRVGIVREMGELDTWAVLEILRRHWIFRNSRPPGQLLVSYNSDAEWHAWRSYVHHLQQILEEALDECDQIVGLNAAGDGDAMEAEDDGNARETGNDDDAMKE